MKLCPKCKRSLHEFQFYSVPHRADKLSCYCKDCCRAANRVATRRWTTKNKEHIRTYSRAYCARPNVVARRKRYMRQYMKNHWVAEHRRNVEYVRERYRHDPVYRLRMTLRNRLNNAIRRGQKAGSAIRDLGCTVAKFKQYLEAQFQPGMTWKNWSRHGWNIHHKRALHLFDLADPTQFKRAVHYTNMRPMWVQEHRRLHSLAVAS